MARAKNVVFVFGQDTPPSKEEIEARAYYKGREIVYYEVSDVEGMAATLNGIGTPAEIFVTDSAPTAATRLAEGDELILEGEFRVL